MTREQYERGYVRLKQRNPLHPLMGVIARGYGPIACEYLEIALKDGDEDPQRRADSLFGRKGHLYSRRAVLSNSFHDAKSDRERADISMQIHSIQEELREVTRAIDIFKRTGKLPKTTIRDKYIPVDGRSRERKLRSVRTSISRYRKLIRTSTDPDQTSKYEDRIKELAELSRQLSA